MSTLSNNFFLKLQDGIFSKSSGVKYESIKQTAIASP
jgi:hypothetical protein